MNTSLHSFLQQADKFHNDIISHGILMKPTDIVAKIDELQKNIKTIQSVAKRMADISNIANHLLKFKHIEYKEKYDVYPESDDHAMLRIQSDSKTVVEDTSPIVVKTVPSANYIPITQICYIRDSGLYGININGVKIIGSIGNIMPYKGPNTAECKFGNKCRNPKTCQYYHQGIRNWTKSSWMYGTKKFQRLVGSRDTLSHDIRILPSDASELKNRKGQLIHDLLILMILHSHGKLHNHVNWF